jgi:hypothetical protein
MAYSVAFSESMGMLLLMREASWNLLIEPSPEKIKNRLG